jgi:hypothetical protein
LAVGGDDHAFVARSKEKGRPVSRTAKKRNLWHPANIFAYIHSAAGKLILAANSVDPVHLRFGLSRAEV